MTAIRQDKRHADWEVRYTCPYSQKTKLSTEKIYKKLLELVSEFNKLIGHKDVWITEATAFLYTTMNTWKLKLLKLKTYHLLRSFKRLHSTKKKKEKKEILRDKSNRRCTRFICQKLY